jgi:Abnormal spindle-like microcephaly-assoc'd, ASPM-SPD-2-Hydin
MKLRQQYQVLVLLVSSITICWLGGCAGVAEPLPSLSVTPTVLSVSAKVGSSSAQTVGVTNIGTTTVSVSQAMVTGTGFTISGLTTPTTLAPNQTQSFSVRFSAQAAGTVNGSLAIMTDAAHRPVVASLKGNGSNSSPSVASVSVTPSAATAAPSAKVQFVAAVQGTTTNDAVQWTATMGTVSSAGVYTAPASAGTGTVTAISVADPTKSASAVVTVSAPSNPPSGSGVTAVSVSPATATVASGATLSLTPVVSGTTTNHAVTWHASTGSISAAGVYTAPISAGTSVVTATSVADPTKVGMSTITVTAAPTNNPSPTPTVTGVSVSPATASSVTGGTLPFSASVAGTTTNKAVIWKAALGTVSAAGLYTAPVKAGTDTVTATSVADGSKAGAAVVTVTAAPTNPAPQPSVSSVTVSPTSSTALTGGTLQFSATVQGTATDKSVSWKAAVGSITSGGLYTAPSNTGSDSVTATSNTDGTKSASAQITVKAQVSNNGGALPAFPEAQGGGAAAVGGRGGTVFEVTNLNDSGSGSFRACLQASGARTCVFRVSGLITFLSRVQVSSPFITVAGQTAPGGGIVIGGANQKGEQLFVSTHDVVVRYLTYDGNNPNTPTGPDTGTVCCEMASGNIYNIVWDHITTRWTGNKAFPVVSNVAGIGIHNTHIQWSLVYEPNLTHAVGIGTVYVSQGSGMATTDDDAHHNMFVTVDHRLPLNQSGRNVRWVNNIVYNWGQFAALSMGGVQTDYIGNKYVDGAGCISSGCLNYNNVHVFLANGNGADPTDETGSPNGDNETGPSMYLLNNTGRTGSKRGSAMVTPTHQANDAGQLSMTQQGAECGEGCDPNSQGDWPSRWLRSSPLPAQAFPIIADDVNQLDSVLLPTVGNSQHLDCNGNWVGNRDSEDQRIIAVYQNHQPDDLFYGQHKAPAVVGGTACTESMHDGIPDQWKAAHGLSTTDSTLHKQQAPNGYTYLENYLNGTSPN